MGIHALVVLLLAVVIVGFVMWCVEVKLLRHWELVEENKSIIIPTFVFKKNLRVSVVDVYRRKTRDNTYVYKCIVKEKYILRG